MNEVIHFLLQIVASTLGILLGAWLARKGKEITENIRYKRRKRR